VHSGIELSIDWRQEGADRLRFAQRRWWTTCCVSIFTIDSGSQEEEAISTTQPTVVQRRCEPDWCDPAHRRRRRALPSERFYVADVDPSRWTG